jgi:hypothetical protein
VSFEFPRVCELLRHRLTRLCLCSRSQEYAKSLLDIEDALDETLGDAWDFSRDPIEIDVSVDVSFVRQSLLLNPSPPVIPFLVPGLLHHVYTGADPALMLMLMLTTSVGPVVAVDTP